MQKQLKKKIGKNRKRKRRRKRTERKRKQENLDLGPIFHIIYKGYLTEKIPHSVIPHEMSLVKQSEKK